MARNRDAYVQIKISEDNMEALANFSPPIGKGNPLDRDYVEKQLQAAGVVEGIDYTAIGDAVLKTNTEHHELQDVVLARGKQDIKERPAFIKLAKHLFHSGPVSDKEKDQFDYRTVSPYVLVKAKEVVGKLIPQREGQDGVDVLGNPVPFGKREVVLFKAGNNLETMGDLLVAKCDGKFERNGDRIWIDEILKIDSGVNYSTGNIRFPGDVVIHGAVQDGFHIFSGGSVHSDDTLDVTEVIARKDVHVAGGIVGKKESVLRAGGEISAKFISRCHIRCKEKIEVSDSIYNSEIFTLDRLIMGDKGKIIGGQVYAINGIEVFQLGTMAESDTFLCVGKDFVVESKLDQVNEKLGELYLKRKHIETALEKEDSADLRSMLAKVNQAAALAEETRAKLQSSLDRNPDAAIVVRGKAFPGVRIEICSTVFTLHDEIHHSKIVLDSANRKIKITPI
ncbi:MAG: DUF342 domain-containing protein [Spirochaetales bacterium]|nr:DUF342 domain-containing protein [Spirochaetales bacterium]